MPSPIDYTARDYEAIRDFLIAKIPEHLPEWTSRSSSDFGIVLIELFSYVGDILNYYNDRIFNESFLNTASLRSSVNDIAAMLGYTPAPRTPAEGEVTFTISESATDPVTIPVGTQISTVSEVGIPQIYFEVIGTPGEEGGDLVITPPTRTGLAVVREGKTVSRELIGVSDGKISQSYPLFQTDVMPDSVVITIEEDDGGGEVTWKKADNLITAKPEEFVYTVTIDGETAYVNFGDGSNGRIPVVGSEIFATYRVGVGADGNVASGAISQLVDAIPRVVGVNNNNAMSGGSNIEDLEITRRLAPIALTALNRAVTTEDYATLAKQVPGVALATAVADVSTQINLYVVPNVGGTTITPTLSAAIQEFFSDKKMINATITIIEATSVPVNITIDVAVKDNYSRDNVETRVEGAINDYFALSNNDLGKTVTLSGIYNAVLSVEGVDYAVVNELYEDGKSIDVANVETLINELPEVGTLTLNATGGVT